MKFIFIKCIDPDTQKEVVYDHCEFETDMLRGTGKQKMYVRARFKELLQDGYIHPRFEYDHNVVITPVNNRQFIIQLQDCNGNYVNAYFEEY